MRLFGGWQQNENFAIEGGITATDDYSFTVTNGGNTDTLDGNYSAIDLSVLGILPVSDAFFVNGRLGYASWNVAIHAVNINDQGTGALYGVGAGYSFNEKGGITIEWMRLSSGADFFFANGAVRFN